jgi:hypothetical protein
MSRIIDTVRGVWEKAGMQSAFLEMLERKREEMDGLAAKIREAVESDQEMVDLLDAVQAATVTTGSSPTELLSLVLARLEHGHTPKEAVLWL